MQLLGLNPLADTGFPMEAEALRRQGPIGEIGVARLGYNRLDPAHPLGHRLQVTPYLPHLIHRGPDLCGDAVLKPTAHGISYETEVLVASAAWLPRIAAAAKRPLMVAPSIESM